MPYDDIPKTIIPDVPETTVAGPDDLVLVYSDAAGDDRTVRVANLLPDLTDYVTDTALAIELLDYLATADLDAAVDVFNGSRATNAGALPADEVLIWDDAEGETRRVRVSSLVPEDAPTPQITTATSLALDASHNGALIVCTDAVTIMASPLPAGFECLVLATNGNVSIAGADLYEADNKTITINGRAASVMQVDGVGAWVTGCDDA